MRHYFNLSIRRLTRNRTYTLLNVAGLAVGVSSGMPAGYRAFRAATANPTKALRIEGRDWL